MSNRSATAMEVFSLSALLLQSLSEINTPLTFSPSHPRLPHSQTTRTYQINAHRIASVFGDSLINPSLLHSMPGPTETPSPVPTTVGYDAENEERSPSPGRAHNTGPLIFAFDGEGGISHAKRLVQRQVAQDGSGRLGEGESQSSVSLFPSTDIHTSFQIQIQK